MPFEPVTSDGFAEAGSEEVMCFSECMIGGKESIPILDERVVGVDGGLVGGIVTIDECDDGGCVDECGGDRGVGRGGDGAAALAR